MVNTFLPFADFEQSMRVLDGRRLLKQRVEAQQVLNALIKVNDHSESNSKKRGWVNHPVVKMWRGYEEALKQYINCAIIESERRGYKNKMPKHVVSMDGIGDKVEKPWWFGWPLFHQSHQASLLRKDPKYYATSFPDLPAEMKDRGYLWPAKFTSEDKSVDLDLTYEALPIIEPLILCAGKYKSGQHKGETCRNKPKRGLFCGLHKP